MKPNIKKIIIISGILVFITALNLAYFLVVPAIINIEKYNPEIRQYLNERLSVPYELGKLKIDMIWNLGIRVKTDKVLLKNHDGSKILGSGTAYVEVSLLPLLNKHVVIRKTEIDNPIINLKRFPEGTFNVEKIFVIKGKPKYKVELKNTSINLNNYCVSFDDNYVSPSKNFVFNGKSIKIKDFTPNKHIEIMSEGQIVRLGKILRFNVFLNTELPFNKKNPTKTKIATHGNIENFDLDEIKPYVNKYGSVKFDSLSGKGSVGFDFDFVNDSFGKRKFYIDLQTTDLNIIDAKKGKVLSCGEKLKLLANGNIDDKDLYFENFQVNSSKINSVIKGLISNYAVKKIRNVDLNIDIVNTRAGAIAEVFPKTIRVPLDPFNKIIKYNIDGNISGSINAKGYYRKPDLFGKIKYDNFSIIAKVPDTQNGFGTVEFMGPTLVINSTQYIDKNEFVKTTGTVVPFKGKKVNLKINSTQNIDFAKILPVLLAVRDMFRFKLTPVTDMDLTGIGKVNLDIEGANKNVTINGYVDAKNATVKYKTLAGKADNVNGKVKFIGKKVYYDELGGSIDGIKVIPSGYSTLTGYSDIKLRIPKLDLEKGQKFIYGSQLLEKTQLALKEIKAIKGFADMTIILQGTEDKLDAGGILKFNNVYLDYNGFAVPFDTLKGQLRFKNEDIYFDKISGKVLGNNAIVDGFTDALNKDIDMTISSEKINMEDARLFVLNSSMLKKSHDIIKEFSSVYGTASFKLVLNGKSDKDCIKDFVINNIDAEFTHKLAGFPIKISQGVINITDNSVQLQNIKANVENTDVYIKGKVLNLKSYQKSKNAIMPDLNLKINKLNSSLINEISKSPILPKKTKEILINITDVKGFAELNADIKPSGFSANINFDNFALIYRPFDMPLEVFKGKMEVTEKSLDFSKINGKISDSEFFANGNIKNYTKNPTFDMKAALHISSGEESRLKDIFKQSFSIKSKIPVSAYIKGTANNWNVHARAALDKGTSLGCSKQIGLSDDIVRTITLNAHGAKDKVEIKTLRLDLYNQENDLHYITPWKFQIDGEKETLLYFSGAIEKLNTLKPQFKNFRMYTNNDKPLSICIFNSGVNSIVNNGNENFFSEGDFKADLIVNGQIYNPNINGYITFSGLKVPDYQLSLNNASIVFNNDQINLELKDVRLEDSSINIQADINNPLETPVMVKNLNITSDFINLDKIFKMIMTNLDAAKTNNLDFKMPSFIVQNGTIDSKELVVHDLITSNVKANLSFTPDWLLSVSDIKLNAGGGLGTANLYYNAKSTELSLNLSAKNIQANAIATTLLRFPNEVYGTMNGDVQLYARGKNSEEIISNTNGYANFKIYDGRLVRLGSMEYFLRAANVLQCGIGGFNFNNIIDLVVPQKTGYFEKLEGKLDIKEGVITTEEIISSGENLGLVISGDYDMLTNYSDIKILGSLSKKVSGLLGPLGSVSINQFIGFVPGFGFLPTAGREKSIVELIPGLSKVPVLGLDFDKKNRQFLVNINGNLYEQSSVKSFRWLD